jgi:hypothetical protein
MSAVEYLKIETVTEQVRDTRPANVTGDTTSSAFGDNDEAVTRSSRWHSME